jgi:hypothetical protein
MAGDPHAVVKDRYRHGGQEEIDLSVHQPARH